MAQRQSPIDFSYPRCPLQCRGLGYSCLVSDVGGLRNIESLAAVELNLCPAGELSTTTYQGIFSFKIISVKYTQFSPAAGVLKVLSPEVHQEFCSTLCFSGFGKLKPFHTDTIFLKLY